MPLPNPDQYSSLRDWARAATAAEAQEKTFRSEDFGTYLPIEEWEDEWESQEDNPLRYCRNRNNFVHLYGVCEVSTGETFVNTDHVFTVPKGILPVGTTVANVGFFWNACGRLGAVIYNDWRLHYDITTDKIRLDMNTLGTLTAGGQVYFDISWLCED